MKTKLTRNKTRSGGSRSASYGMITIYTLTYNEELLIQFMIDHYRARFPNCRIVVYDSGSTDKTTNIARTNSCEVRTFFHDGGFDESRHVAIKNTAWEDAATDWILTCDVDELLDINEDELLVEEKLGTTIIRSEAYDMVAMDDKLDIAGMQYGVRDPGQDKAYVFNKKNISEINYASGCHSCRPIGTVIYSRTSYKLYHYCYINYDVTVARYKTFRARINPEEQKLSGYYSESPEEIRDLYTQARNKAVKVK